MAPSGRCALDNRRGALYLGGAAGPRTAMPGTAATMSVTPSPVPQSSATPTARPCPSSSLGPTLEPALRKACDDRLSPIEWFRSDWQRGGGSTGFAELRLPTGEAARVVVKVPVGPTELRWTLALGRTGDGDAHGPAGLDCPTPRVFAAGTALNGYDLGWLVMERLEGKPLAAEFSAPVVTDVLRACARWQARAEAVAPPGSPPPVPDWAKTIEHSREVARRGSIPEAQRWNNHLHDVARALPTILKRWGARRINTWCHGDLHLGNAMRRAAHNGHTGAPCVLLDLALVHAGHWVEDALYLERVYWGHPDHLHGVNPVSTLAAFRRELGLEASDNYGLLASVRRVLTAAGAPALLEREGNKRYLAHALDVIHRLLPMVAH